jgi:N-carbamoylputrescine amidase
MPRVCAVQLWSSKTHTPDDNRNHALDMLGKAASERNHDLIVLPEAVSMLCYPDDRPDFTYYDVAEEVPGPTTDAAGRIAREHQVNVIIGLIQRRNNGCQNMAIVIDRSGEIVGLYEKRHEPEVCIREQAALEGSDAPVFDLDFGRVGIFICWDLYYSDITDELEANGAELLVFPHLMSFAIPKSQASTLRQRARETGLPIVAAGMRDEHNHNGGQDGLWPTGVLDGEGQVVVQTDAPKSDLISAVITTGRNKSTTGAAGPR